MKKNLAAGVCMCVVIFFAAGLFMGGAAFADDNMGQGAVELNTATVKELSTLPGIGKKRAQAIIAYRTENSRFKSVDELRKIEGIGKKTFDKIRESVVVE